jgi:MOSC domain-containing protein YiiM
MPPRVVSVGSSPTHTFSKPCKDAITFLTGRGVEGDAHCGDTVKHRSHEKREPTKPNLRQVHLIHSELFAELAARGFSVGPGQLGENLCTEGVDLLRLPEGAELHIGAGAVLRVTGLRSPCSQIDQFQPGLMAALLERTADGGILRKSGVMSVVLAGGVVRPGDAIRVELPPGPHRELQVV